MVRLAAIVLLSSISTLAMALPLSEGDIRLAGAVLSRAGEEGLDPGQYRADSRDAASVRAALLSYMGDLGAGRPALRQLDQDVALPDSSFNPEAALDEAIGQGKVPALLNSLAPPHREYALLKSALARYRAIAAGGGWPPVASGASAQLRRRLAYEDDIAGRSNAEAVRRFQLRHGLAADGVAGPATLAALNVPAAARADTIAANMERWRWLPRRLEDDRIVINAANAELEFFLQGKPVLTSRVIVGRPGDPTPILRAEGAGITLNPFWTVPASIAAREILPRLKRNSGYLAAHDMVLLNGPPGDPHGLDVNWKKVRAGTFPYSIRQYPGPRNPLGLIKLELPNRFHVYLHDTPDKAAFSRTVRDISHGCVRVEKILPLASYALSGDAAAQEKIAAAAAAGETKYLPLQKKLPVYFLYWTAYFDASGDLQFRNDIYGRDQRLIAAARARPMALAQAHIKCSRA